VLPLDNLVHKFKSFNINTINVQNGHSFKEIISAFKKISSRKANAIILNTVKGKGISKFENDPVWHARKLQKDEIEIDTSNRSSHARIDRCNNSTSTKLCTDQWIGWLVAL
jgi:transketolase